MLNSKVFPLSQRRRCKSTKIKILLETPGPHLHSPMLLFCLLVLDLSYFRSIKDVSMLGNLHMLILHGCYNITDVSALGNIKHLDHEPYDVAEIELKNTGKVDNVYNVVYEDLFIDCNVVMGLNKSAVKEYSLKNIDILEKICTMAKHTDTLDRLSGYRARLEAVNG